MTIEEHMDEFGGLRVEEYDPQHRMDEPSAKAWRLSIDYDAEERGVTFAQLFESFLADPGSGQATALLIGSWGNSGDSSLSSAEVVERLVAASARLPALRALFLGDITREEVEISWIEQSNLTPLLQAFPDLEHLQVRGGSGLEIEPGVRHDHLRSLIVESGGLPPSFVRAIGSGPFPNLEHLELWLGTSDYGGDTTVEDLGPILGGKLFPKLKYLGLRDSEIADEVAAALASAPVVQRLEVLDLSLGNLSDEGAVALLQSQSLAGLKKLDIHHHFVSDEVLDGLVALGIELDASDRREPYEWDDEGNRYIAVSE